MCLFQCSFYCLWSKHFPRLIIPKQPRQAKCQVCVTLAEVKATNSVSDTIKQQLSIIQDLHRAAVIKERFFYWIKRDMAIRNPQRYLSIIVDGMDQTCTALPNFKPLIRKLSPLVDVHVTGVYNHSSRKMHCMVSHEAIRKDSNLTILSIIQALKHTPSPWPPQLFLQVSFALIFSVDVIHIVTNLNAFYAGG